MYAEHANRSGARHSEACSALPGQAPGHLFVTRCCTWHVSGSPGIWPLIWAVRATGHLGPEVFCVWPDPQPLTNSKDSPPMDRRVTYRTQCPWHLAFAFPGSHCGACACRSWGCLVGQWGPQPSKLECSQGREVLRVARCPMPSLPAGVPNTLPLARVSGDHVPAPGPWHLDDFSVWLSPESLYILDFSRVKGIPGVSLYLQCHRKPVLLLASYRNPLQQAKRV